MTVAELIEELQKYEPQLEVCVRIATTADAHELVGTPVLTSDPGDKVWLQLITDFKRLPHPLDPL